MKIILIISFDTEYDPYPVKKVPDPAGQKSPDPDRHHGFASTGTTTYFPTQVL